MDTISIALRATNTEGSAESNFSLTVQEMLLNYSATLSGLTSNPTYGPCAQDNVSLTATSGGFSAETPVVFSYQWKTEQSGTIVGARDASFTPNAGLYDGETLFCTITPDGYPAKDTTSAVIRRLAPAGTGTPGEQFWDLDTGNQVIAMGDFVIGDVLVWSVAGQGASINAATGVLDVRTDSQAIGAVARVTARNSGGSVDIAFSFHIENLDAGPGPELGTPILDDVADTIGLTLDEESTVYWRRDPVGTNPDPADVVSGGGHDSGSFAANQGTNSVSIAFALGNDGPQEISFVAAAPIEEQSLVRTVAVDIDTEVPVVASSLPMAGAVNVATNIEPKISFSKPVTRGPGSITLYDVTTSTAAEVFDIAADAGGLAGQVNLSAHELTIKPSSFLEGGKTYAVLFESGAIRDEAGNVFEGILSTTEMSFSTEGSAVLDTTFDANFATQNAAVWTSMQSNGFNATIEHRAAETWDAYTGSLSDAGVVGAKTGIYPQIRFAVPVEVGKTYTIDADLPLGEGSWLGPLRVKLGSAIDLSDYTQIDETEVGQPRVAEIRGQQFTATTSEFWLAIIVQTANGGSNGGSPALSMLRVQEV